MIDSIMKMKVCSGIISRWNSIQLRLNILLVMVLKKLVLFSIQISRNMILLLNMLLNSCIVSEIGLFSYLMMLRIRLNGIIYLLNGVVRNFLMNLFRFLDLSVKNSIRKNMLMVMFRVVLMLVVGIGFQQCMFVYFSGLVMKLVGIIFSRFISRIQKKMVMVIGVISLFLLWQVFLVWWLMNFRQILMKVCYLFGMLVVVLWVFSQNVIMIIRFIRIVVRKVLMWICQNIFLFLLIGVVRLCR